MLLLLPHWHLVGKEEGRVGEIGPASLQVHTHVEGALNVCHAVSECWMVE